MSGGFGLGIEAQLAFLVPLRARELGADFEMIGLIVGAGALAPALAALTTGAVIDRIGPKRAYVAGTFATALCCIPFLVAEQYGWFIVFRGLLGLSRNLAWVASQTNISGLGTPEQRSALAGRFSFFGSGGQMVGPVLAGTAGQLAGFRYALVLPLAYSLAFALLGLTLTTPERSGARTPQGMGVRSSIALLGIRGIQIAMVLSGTRLWTSFLFFTFVPVYLVEQGFASAMVGAVIATAGLVGTLLALTVGFWTRYLSEQRVAMVGLGCGAAALAITPHVASVPAVFVVPLLMGMATGLSLPILLSLFGAAAPPGQLGVALGLRSLVNQVAGTAAPVIVGGLIGALGMTLGFSAGSAVAAAALVIVQVITPSPAATARKPEGTA